MDLSIFPVWVDILLFVAGTIVAVLAVYGVSRLVLARRSEDDTAVLAGSVIFRVAALHSLILALVFAQEQINFNELRANIVNEADAVADIYNDLIRYDEDATADIRAQMVAYTQEATGPEWETLANARLSQQAWSLWDDVYGSILNLTPTTQRQEWLHENLRDDIDAISDARTQRELAADGRVTPLFWVAAIGGLLLVAIPYFTFSATPLHIMLLAVFAGYNGIILFFIVALANPFTDPASIQPRPFERLLEVWVPSS